MWVVLTRYYTSYARMNDGYFYSTQEEALRRAENLAREKGIRYHDDYGYVTGYLVQKIVMVDE